MKIKLVFFLLIPLCILIGWLVVKNQISKPTSTNSDKTVVLKLPTKNDKTLEYKEKIVSGDNVFSLLKRVTTRENISLGYKENEDGFVYVYQIGEVGGMIMDCSLVLLVNNKEVFESLDKYYLTTSDEIEWVFRCADK